MSVDNEYREKKRLEWLEEIEEISGKLVKLTESARAGKDCGRDAKLIEKLDDFSNHVDLLLSLLRYEGWKP